MKSKESVPAAKIVDLQIERLTQGGRGLARREGKVVFVRGGLPGESVRARIEKEQAKFDEAVVVERLTSTHRDAPCPHFEQCGGCDWMRLDETTQLAEKAAIVRADAERALGSLAEAWQAPVASPAESYRCRITLKLANGAVGYYAEGSHTLVPIAECRIAVAAIQNALPALTKDAGRFRAAGYEEIELRASAIDVKPVGVLSGSGTLPLLPEYLRGLADRKQSVGDCYLGYSVAGKALKAGPNSFVQVNLAVNDLLVRYVDELLDASGPVVDAYCGNGNFSVPLAAKHKVFGMESNRDALRDASENAEKNAVKLDWAAATDEQMAQAWQRSGFSSMAALLLDPPRAGAKGLLAGLEKHRITPPTIVYVSCEPATLLRDLRTLKTRGYVIDAFRCFDMFPQTHHVETVVRLHLG